MLIIQIATFPSFSPCFSEFLSKTDHLFGFAAVVGRCCKKIIIQLAGPLDLSRPASFTPATKENPIQLMSIFSSHSFSAEKNEDQDAWKIQWRFMVIRCDRRSSFPGYIRVPLRTDINLTSLKRHFFFSRQFAICNLLQRNIMNSWTPSSTHRYLSTEAVMPLLSSMVEVGR